MEEENFAIRGAMWYSPNISENATSTGYSLPSELTEISNSSLLGVFAYSVVFVLAIILYAFVIPSLWKRYRVKKTRIFLLLLHLSLADLIVCAILVPTEIFWRLSGSWEGGNILCKATQFFRAYGLYLSSLILIWLSVDRFISIIFPLQAIGTGAYRRIKWMIGVAWIAAVIFSIPQIMLFSVRSHPEFESHTQCVTSFRGEKDFNKVKIYSIFSLVVMYFLPLAVIATSYTAILLKLVIKSQEHKYTTSLVQSVARYQRGTSLCTVTHEVSSTDLVRTELQLRCSTNAHVNLTKAKMRTLLMTVVMIFAFIICWTPYAIMTLWYIIDIQEAQNVDPRIQDALFLMVVANSCINPLIYGGFFKKNSS